MIFHSSPRAMAATLVQYIPCDRKIQQEVLVSLDVRLDMDAIAMIRKRANKPMAEIKRDDSVTRMDELLQNNMDAANRAFVRAIANARIAA